MVTFACFVEITAAMMMARRLILILCVFVNIWGLGTLNLLFATIVNPRRAPKESCVLPFFSSQSGKFNPPETSQFFNVLLSSRPCHEIIQHLTQEELASIPRDHNETMLLSGSVVIGPEGDAMQCHAGAVIPSMGCKGSLGPLPSCDETLPAYSTVIVISQYWGEGYFHFFIEGIPRLMDVDPRVYSGDVVHVHTNMADHSIASQMLSLISGNFRPIRGSVRAVNAVIPPPTPCGGHRYSRRHLPLLRLSLQTQLTVGQPRHVVLVRRHGSRAIANHDELLREISQAFPVIVHEGSEPILDQLQMFSDAFLAIAPHGAGLSNAVVMQAKTAVIEMLPNHMNACYALLAFNLGLRYSPYYDPDFTHENAVSVNVSYLADMARLLDTRAAIKPGHAAA